MRAKLLLSLAIFLICACPSLFAAEEYTFDPKSSYHSLYIPEGKGPFPAILLLHASGGVEMVNHDWANILKDAGYIVYIIDSFQPRGWKDRKSIGWEKATAAQLSDVAPAYRYLSHLPIVNPKRIGLLGFSMGGYDVLAVMDDAKQSAYQNVNFKAAAAFYGVCHRLRQGMLLKENTKIFIGSKDDRATTNDCSSLVNRSQMQHKNISMTIYDDALHGFDNFHFPTSKEVVDEKGEHYHIGFNAEARKLAMQDLPKYFAKYLK